MQVTEGEEAARREYDGMTYYFCSKACARKFQQNPESYIGTEMPVEQPVHEPIAAPGGMAKSHIDPVCKMVVREGSDAANWDYKGTTYYFCNPNCLKRFMSEPERFLQGQSPKDKGQMADGEGQMASGDLPEPVILEKPELGKTETVTLSVGGMSCASCVATVEKALNRLPGVKTATVNFAIEKAIVEFDPKVSPVPALEKAVVDVGYEIRHEAPGSEDLA